MRRPIAVGLSLTAVFLCGIGTASARPLVALKLSGAVVERAADGSQHTVALDRHAVKSGEIVRYDVLALNSGDSQAAHLVPSARIPAGTSYVPASASHDAVRVEFSLDGGKTWSATPTIAVKAADGTLQTRKADPASYTQLRWIAQKPLAAKAAAHYTYEVRVK